MSVLPRHLRIRRRTHEVLEVARPGDQLSRVIDIGLISLVAGNVLAVVLHSVHDIAVRYQEFFEVFELISVVVFTAELALRIWIAVEAGSDGKPGNRLRYIFSPLALADIAAITPFYLSAFFSLDLRYLRILRLLRVLKLTRYSGALTGLKEVFRIHRGAFGSAFILLILVMIASSSTMYIVEHEAQPEAFSSIPAAMWWAVATLTTVGYGDITPVTSMGKLIASLITIVGVGMVALPTSILAAGFADLHQRNRRELEAEAAAAFDDGYLSREESEAYEELAARLGVPREEAAHIIALAQRAMPAGRDADCPHCGKAPNWELPTRSSQLESPN